MLSLAIISKSLDTSDPFCNSSIQLHRNFHILALGTADLHDSEGKGDLRLAEIKGFFLPTLVSWISFLLICMLYYNNWTPSTLQVNLPNENVKTERNSFN